MKKKRFLFFIVIFCIVIFLFTSLTFVLKRDKNSYGNIVKSKYNSIKIVMDDNYPPYTFRDDNGNLQGILIDQWKLWEEKTGIKVYIYGEYWNSALDEMSRGNYDVIDTMFENSEREKVYDFSKPYAKIDVPIFFPNSISGIASINSLNGFTVGVKSGDSSVEFLKTKGINKLQEFDSYSDMIKAAKNKEIAILVMDKPPALYYMFKEGVDGEFKFSNPLYTGEFHRAVKKGNTELLNVVELGFNSISDEEYKKIDEKWIGNTNQYRNIVLYLKYGAATVIVFFLILGFWNIILKRKVNRSENENIAIIKAIPDMIFILDDKGKIKHYLSSNNNYIFENKDKFIGKKVIDIFPQNTSDIIMGAIKKTIEGKGTVIVEYSLMIRNEKKYFESRFALIQKDKILTLVRNITDRKNAEKEIYKMGMYDVITGLYNRNFFENQFEKYIEEKILNYALIICDIDGLKLINDTFGHSAGDNYIKATADILRKCFKDRGIIARIGGDEFAILMKDTTEEEIINYKENLNLILEESNTYKDSIPVSISVGYSLINDVNKNFKDVFKEADDYMYREKLHHKQSVKSKNIDILTKMLEARDFITQGHGERLKQIVTGISKAVGMSDNDVKDMILFAEFHDIGKIGIPDSILFKPGSLNDEERAVMKRHTEIGYRIAQSSPDLIPISDWVLKHHETFDGKGYPLNLKGEEIPIQCRILAIADSYDAMTNDRPYRKAMSKEMAIEEIKRCKGTQFDPYLVEVFLQYIN